MGAGGGEWGLVSRFPFSSGMNTRAKQNQTLSSVNFVVATGRPPPPVPAKFSCARRRTVSARMRPRTAVNGRTWLGCDGSAAKSALRVPIRPIENHARTVRHGHRAGLTSQRMHCRRERCRTPALRPIGIWQLVQREASFPFPRAFPPAIVPHCILAETFTCQHAKPIAAAAIAAADDVDGAVGEPTMSVGPGSGWFCLGHFSRPCLTRSSAGEQANQE